MASQIIKVDCALATIYIANEANPSVNYSYGGTRMVAYDMEETKILKTLNELMLYESALKNRLINRAFKEGALNKFIGKTPGLINQSVVGGARCLIQPASFKISNILSNPHHSQFIQTISPIMEEIGKVLNDHEGNIKLTPDFGHYAGLSDILVKYTEHVLGISCDNGGCGGKTSYSSTGVIAAFKAIGGMLDKNIPITLIGSAGAMGTDVLKFLMQEKFANIAVSDIAYKKNEKNFNSDLVFLPSKFGMFTKKCLERGGILIMTTIGHELENSPTKYIPPHTKLILAHNLAIPSGRVGIELVKKLQRKHIFILPGQVITLGGALTSRLEWFWRQANKGEPFDKKLAHLIVENTVTFLTDEIQRISIEEGITPYEATLKYAETFIDNETN